VATSQSTATATLREAAPSAESATATPTLEATFAPTGTTTEATVVRVTDGDTIVVSYGGDEHKVRYIGMDTPETVDPNDPLQWMGPEATKANEALVEGKTVYLEKDMSEVDQFDRLLRYVWLTDGTAWTLVNLELVRQGVAFAKSYPPDVRYDSVYAEAESVARNSAFGLWQATPARPTAAPTPVFLVPPPAEAKCHPSYDPCLPIVDDLDCKDIRAMGKDPVRIKGSDPYLLDGSDNDGLGCE
jgi:micrococcal nuclease